MSCVYHFALFGSCTVDKRAESGDQGSIGEEEGCGAFNVDFSEAVMHF